MSNRKIGLMAFGLTITFSLLLFIIFFHDFSYAFGLLIGGLTSILGFALIVIMTNRLDLRNLRTTRKQLILGRIIRSLLYLGVLILAILNKENISFLTIIVGLFVIKLSIVIENYRNKVRKG